MRKSINDLLSRFFLFGLIISALCFFPHVSFASNDTKNNQASLASFEVAYNGSSSKMLSFQNKSVTVSNLNATKITSDSAVIKWDLTDKGTGYVQYGRSRNGMHQESKKEFSFRYDKHIQTITRLRPNTTYYYRARSAGRDNKEVISDTKSFRTESLGSSNTSSADSMVKALTISDLEVTSIKGESAVIKWKLNQKGTGYVEFGTSYNLGQESKREKSYNRDAHTQTISGLKPDTRYYYRVKSADRKKNEVVSTKRSFRTPALPMKISNVTAKATERNVVFKWDLNQHGTGVVEFAPSRKFGRTTKPQTSLKWDSHRQEADGLKPSTTYYYRVKSAAKDGVEVVSNTYSFRTSGVPVVASNKPDPAPTSSPSPAPSNTGSSSTGAVGWPKNANPDLPMAGIFYGNYTAGVGLQNAGIGIESSRRFRAERTGAINYVRYHNRTLNMANIKDRCKKKGPGSKYCNCVDNGLDEYTCGYTLGSSYSVGNGGTIVVELRTNTSKGTPSNEVLGKTKPFVPMENKKIPHPELKFVSPVRIKEGQLYHLVFTNLTPPTSCTALSNVKPSEASKCPRNQGAQGLNGPRFITTPTTTGLGGPYLGDDSAANYYRRTKNHSWTFYKYTRSWYEVGYTDGVAVGDSYTPINAMSIARHTIGGATKARQNFVVQDASRHVNGMWLNFGHTKTADGSPLNVVLKDKGGKALATGSIKASAHCRKTVQGPKGNNLDWCHDWGYTSFKTSVNLVKGSAYSVELSGGPKSGFILVGHDNKEWHGFKNRNVWSQSRVELSKDNGSSWTGFSPVRPQERDLPLLFTIVGMPKQMK